MIHLTNIDSPAAITPAQARERSLALMQKFFHADTTHKEWFDKRGLETPLLTSAQGRVDIARHIVWRLVNKPEANSDVLFLLADALRELTTLQQFCHRTTSSLRLLADLVADEAATRPPALITHEDKTP